jgi:hypothetical protein
MSLTVAEQKAKSLHEKLKKGAPLSEVLSDYDTLLHNYPDDHADILSYRASSFARENEIKLFKILLKLQKSGVVRGCPQICFYSLVCS